MIKKLLFFIVLIVFVSCGSSKNVTQNTPRKVVDKRTNTSKKINSAVKTETVKKGTTNNDPTIADKIVWTAVSYKGTPYKYAGITKSGMDCSGLVYTSFKSRGIELPRSSSMLYTKGYKIPLSTVKRGDLLFFKTTNKSRSKINHVALVTSVSGKDVKFIHATSSRGVIVSSILENYWNNAFIEAKRILD